MAATYRTATAWAAVTAMAAGVPLIVPGTLDTPQSRVRVQQQVRRHARALGVQAHAEWVACRDGDDGRPVTEFTVRPGPARKLLAPALRAQVLAAHAAGGVTQRQLAARFGIAQPRVSEIIRKGDGT